MDPRSTVSKPETGPYLYTFTSRLPFVLGFEDSFDHDIAVAGQYADEADAVVFGRSPFVRVRIFNADVADRKFAAANLPAAIEHFYGQDVPSGDVDGNRLYEQWMTLETPAVFVSHEPRWDPAFAFHRSMSALNLFLEAFAIARDKDWIRPVSTRELRPTVAIGRLDLDGNWTYQGPMLIHPDAKPSPLSSRPVAQHVEELNQALELIVNEAPFIRARQWRARAERRKYEGDAADSVISFQVAAETMLYELWGLLLLEEGTALQEVDKRRYEQPFKTLLSSELAPRLGGSWDLMLERKPVGGYWVDLYKLRNRIVHGGYQPHDGDAEKAERAYFNLERFIDERLRAKGKQYPATLSARRGEGVEVLLARLDAQGDAEAAGMLGQLLQNRGDSAGAEAAFRRSQERGALAASVSLGKMLIEKGDLAGAEAAWRHADLGGSAEGAANLGTFLHLERADPSGAEAAWRRADDRGSPEGTLNLGVAHAERGDLAGAEAAWRRADDRGSADAALNLGNLLHTRGDHEAAEAAWARADQRGSAGGAYGIGLRAQERGDVDAAEAAFRRADERGSAQGAASLARVLEQKGSLTAAEELYGRAAERGNLEGAFNLGVLLHKKGRLSEAENAYRQAAAGGFGKAMFNLGVLSLERGETQEAKAAFLQVIALNEPDLTERAREALAECEG
ncbi:MAG: sel1 repeat family protein [Solirubrobacterales bacterium]|nr:sel1 repeat family protein [Solirubrobacterales bacterium]